MINTGSSEVIDVNLLKTTIKHFMNACNNLFKFNTPISLKLLFEISLRILNCFRKGVSVAQAILPSEGQAVYTVMFCVIAAGEYLPPNAVYKANDTISYPVTHG